MLEYNYNFLINKIQSLEMVYCYLNKMDFFHYFYQETSYMIEKKYKKK